MGVKKVVGYIIIGSLGFVAAILAFAAEATRIKISDIQRLQDNTCVYPKSSAYILGYVAAVLTLIVQIIVSVVARCACCNGRNSNSTGAIICFVFSWVVSVIGIGLLNSAARLSTRHEILDQLQICYTLRPGMFAAGGVLVFVTTILGICAYGFSSKYNHQQEQTNVPYQGGIAMGHPQYPTAYDNTYPPKPQHV